MFFNIMELSNFWQAIYREKENHPSLLTSELD